MEVGFTKLGIYSFFKFVLIYLLRWLGFITLPGWSLCQPAKDAREPFQRLRETLNQQGSIPYYIDIFTQDTPC